jgi:hypothetical protein
MVKAMRKCCGRYSGCGSNSHPKFVLITCYNFLISIFFLFKIINTESYVVIFAEEEETCPGGRTDISERVHL